MSKKRYVAKTIFGHLTRVDDPNGPYPSCIPGLHASGCVRCGEPIHYGRDQENYPCKAIPPDQRWKLLTKEQLEQEGLSVDTSGQIVPLKRA